MEAPDKIYLHRTTGNPRNNGKVHSYKPAKIRDDDKIIEYIRKDALLEWAEKKIAKGMIDEWDRGYVQCLKDLIDKLNNF